jgi:SPP1 family predicted phage head-tail adaptor
MSLEAGRLNKRVTLQSHGITQDANGTPVEGWSDVATVWAAVEPLSGREFFAAAQVQAEQMQRITIRYRAGIDTAMRVAWAGRLFDITAVIDWRERHEFLQLMCRELQ